MRVYIGEFTGQDLKEGKDKQAIKEAQDREELKRNGIKYIESEIIKRNRL